MKRAGEKIAGLTIYDNPTAAFEEAAGIDMILVSDSLDMCVYGYSGTVPVTMDRCIVHSEAVRRGAPHAFIGLRREPWEETGGCRSAACRPAARGYRSAA
jgi:3-methyl-2-oxobutanoate hydroxymethyltransferase